MGIRIERGVAARIRENPGAILLQVSQASDVEAATEALRRARAEIADLNGGAGSAPGLGPGDRNNPKYVGEVVPAGPGPCLFVDGGHTPARLLATIPKIVARHLEAAGVTDAVVSVPPLGGPLLEALTRRPKPGLEVDLTLYPPPPPNFRRVSTLPDAWLDLAQAWVCEGLAPDDELFAELAPGIEFPVPVSQAGAFLRQGRATRNALCVLVSGDPHERLRALTLRCSSQEQTASLSAAGNRDDTDELLVEYSRLRDLGRSVAAEVAYAHLTLEPHVGKFAVIDIMGEWASLHGGAQPSEVGMFCDRILKDAFPFQILGPRHLERLGEARAGAEPLADGRVELSFGDPSDWLPDDPPAGWEEPPARWAISRWRRDKTIQPRARQALRPCLIRSGQSRRLFPIADVE